MVQGWYGTFPDTRSYEGPDLFANWCYATAEKCFVLIGRIWKSGFGYQLTLSSCPYPHCTYCLMPYHYNQRISYIGRCFTRSLLQAPARSRTTQSRLVKAIPSQGLSISNGDSTASVSSFQFCFLKCIHKWGVFFSIQQENPSVCKWRDKTSNYVSKFICINIHSITSELWGNGIAKPEANSVSDLGALIFHDISWLFDSLNYYLFTQLN